MKCEALNGIYRGKVLATDSGESTKSGRIKVEVYPYLIGKDTAVRLNKSTTIKIEGMETNDIPWAMPAAPLFYGASSTVGSISIPDVGSDVFVFFEGGDIFSPVYFANAVNGATGIPNEAQTDYPKTSVLKTPNGILISINDETGNITITSTNDTNLNSGNNLNITVGGVATITASGDISVEAENISLTGNSSINLN